MEKFCSNCGVERKENTNFCPNCGKSINNSKQPGKGKAIASMVLGIIALCWGLLSILAIEDIEFEIYYMTSIAEFIGFFIGFNLFSLPTSIIGLTLGLTSKIKSGIKLSGIITCSIALIITIINLIVMITYYF